MSSSVSIASANSRFEVLGVMSLIQTVCNFCNNLLQLSSAVRRFQEASSIAPANDATHCSPGWAVPAMNRARANILGHSRLPGNRCPVAYRDVLVSSHLPGDHASPPNPRAARKPGQRRNHRVLAYVAVVTDLNQIVELYTAAKHRVAKASSIDRAVCSYLAIVLYSHAVRAAAFSPDVPASSATKPNPSAPITAPA